MSFKIGDTIKIKDTAKTATVKCVYEAGYWGMPHTEYAVEYTDGSGVGHLSELICERILEAYTGPACLCGLEFTNSGGVHSSYCNLSGQSIKDKASQMTGVD